MDKFYYETIHQRGSWGVWAYAPEAVLNYAKMVYPDAEQSIETSNHDYRPLIIEIDIVIALVEFAKSIGIECIEVEDSDSVDQFIQKIRKEGWSDEQ